MMAIVLREDESKKDCHVLKETPITINFIDMAHETCKFEKAFLQME